MIRSSVQVAKDVIYVNTATGINTQVGGTVYNEVYSYINDGCEILIEGDLKAELLLVRFNLTDGVTPLSEIVLYSKLTMSLIHLSDYNQIGDLFFLTATHANHPVIRLDSSGEYNYDGYSTSLVRYSVVHHKQPIDSTVNLWMADKTKYGINHNVYVHQDNSWEKSHLCFNKNEDFVLDYGNIFVVGSDSDVITILKTQVSYAVFTPNGYYITGTETYALGLSEDSVIVSNKSKGVAVLTSEFGWVYIAASYEKPPIVLKQGVSICCTEPILDCIHLESAILLVFEDIGGARCEQFNFNLPVESTEVELVGLNYMIRITFFGGTICDFDVTQSGGEYKCSATCIL